MNSGDSAAERSPPTDERCRERVVEIVEDEDLPVTLDTLTERVIECEPEIAATAESRSAIHERLYLSDLPALERENELAFDIERGLVTTGDRSSAVAAVEAGTTGDGSRDPASVDRGRSAWRYLAATGVAVGLFALATLEIGAFMAISPTLVAMVAVGLFAGLALTDGR